ncbi:hypothetical protein HDU76_009051 [Blyttiomyces sp. JEL0837]|nr:hypothetical protein HDU76_009051 [Blyttiomyces sp. JEL0837]
MTLSSTTTLPRKSSDSADSGYGRSSIGSKSSFKSSTSSSSIVSQQTLVASTNDLATPTPATAPSVDLRQHGILPLALALERREIAADRHANLPVNEVKARSAVRFALRTSRKMDHFHVDRVMGFGANGVVLSATAHKNPSLKVAIKIIYKDRSGSIQVPNEITILRFLSSDSNAHPYIIRRLADWQDDRHYYLVTENAGHDWTSNLAIPDSPQPFAFYNPRLNRPEQLSISQGSNDLYSWATMNWMQSTSASDLATDESTAKSIFVQIAAAVSHMHSLGVAHGDIKEENVIVCPGTDGIRLIDFGHARHAATEDFNGAKTYGTPEFTAPEYLKRGVTQVNAFKSDVYALGLLLFSLRHGPSETPMVAQAIGSVLVDGNGVGGNAKDGLFEKFFGKSEGGVFPFLEGDLSDGVEPLCVDLMKAMLNPDPRKRVSMEEVMVHPWVVGV